jgi:hypothetical protein
MPDACSWIRKTNSTKPSFEQQQNLMKAGDKPFIAAVWIESTLLKPEQLCRLVKYKIRNV